MPTFPLSRPTSPTEDGADPQLVHGLVTDLLRRLVDRYRISRIDDAQGNPRLVLLIRLGPRSEDRVLSQPDLSLVCIRNPDGTYTSLPLSPANGQPTLVNLEVDGNHLFLRPVVGVGLLMFRRETQYDSYQYVELPSSPIAPLRQ